MGACLRSISPVLLAGLLFITAGAAVAQDRVPAEVPTATSSPATRPANPAGEFLSGAELAVTIKSAELLVRDMAAATDPEEAKRLGEQALDALRPVLRDPELSDLAAWRVAGVLAIATKDGSLAQLAYEAISRLKPSYHEEDNYLTLMAKLKLLTDPERLQKTVESRQRIVRLMRDAHSPARIGSQYAKGDGVYKNETEAVAWFRIGAQTGEVDSFYMLGTCYANGIFVRRDFAEATKWFRRGADAGHVGSMINLSSSYVNGYGVERDEGKAFALIHNAANTGHVDAMRKIAFFYKFGVGVERDFAKVRE